MAVGSLVSWFVVAIALGFAMYKLIEWYAASRRESASRAEKLIMLGRAAFAVAVACFVASVPVKGESLEVALSVAALAFVGLDVWLNSRARS